MNLSAIAYSRFGKLTIRWGGVAAVLVLAAFLGTRPSFLWLALLAGGVGVFILSKEIRLGLLAVVVAAIMVPFELGTGTAVALNLVTLVVPAMLGVWFLEMVFQKKFRVVSSGINRPLFLFLIAGLFSLLIGNALWDPAVPRSNTFIIVQIAQLAIFAFSAGAFWLTGNLIRDEVWLRRLTFFYLGFAGTVAILFVIPRVGVRLSPFTTGALNRAPFWMLLAAVAVGQLLFNQKLSDGWRVFLVLVLVAVLVFAFYWTREQASTWVSVVAVVGVLSWFRWPQLRWPVLILLLALAVTGILSSVIYEFAGGDDEWEESGGSRLTLIGRVIEVTMRNPITGIGPAAYRPYARLEPLLYGRALWLQPQVSSHNNYVDLFSHVGLVGLAIFFWFVAELVQVGARLRTRFRSGFTAGYLNSALAAGVGSLVLMLFGDWILPFVYNIGFRGFQASILVWLFLGGLLALEQMEKKEDVAYPGLKHRMTGPRNGKHLNNGTDENDNQA